MIYFVWGLIFLFISAILLKIWNTVKNSAVLILVMLSSLALLQYFCIYQFKNDYTILFVEKIEKTENVEYSENVIENKSAGDSIDEDSGLHLFAIIENSNIYNVFKSYFQEFLISLMIILIAIAYSAPTGN